MTLEAGKMSEVSKSGLTKEELEALERAEKFLEERAKAPKSKRTSINTPDKYSLPIGIDDKGEAFPTSEEEKPE